MRKFAYSFTGLVLAATAAHAQPAADVTGAVQSDVTATVEGPEAPAASGAAELGASGDTAAEASLDVTAEASADNAVDAADSAAPGAVDAAASASVSYSDAEVESFAKATVKLQEIEGNATMAADQKQTAMAAAVSEAGLDPAKYNEIGGNVMADAALRARVQTAMARHAEPSDG